MSWVIMLESLPRQRVVFGQLVAGVKDQVVSAQVHDKLIADHLLFEVWVDD